MSTPKKAAVAEQTETQLVIPQASPEVQLVKLEVIEIKPQVRTVFDDESLAELAEDIKAHGIIQPVTLRNNRGKMILVAGERRVRAAKLAGLVFVPAIIAKMTEAEAETVQLAENIHREDLSTEDLAAAVKRLYDIHKKVDIVAGILKKSKSWVSKHLALASGLGWAAAGLLRDGHTDDMELLLTINKLQNIDYAATQKLCNSIAAGEAGRKEAREVLKAVKEKIAKQKAKQESKSDEQENDTENSTREKEYQQTPWAKFRSVQADIREGKTIAEALKQLSMEDHGLILALEEFSQPHDAGKVAKQLSSAADQVRHLIHYGDDYGMYLDNEHVAAYLVGMTGKSWTLENLLTEIGILNPVENDEPDTEE